MAQAPRARIAFWALAALAALAALGCSPHGSPRADVAVQHEAAFDAELRHRIELAETYAKSRPGIAGIVLRDRETGAVWRTADAKTRMWACSTPKLAIAVDLLVREDQGTVALTAEDRAHMHDMLHTSDNAAAHALWNRYGGEAEFGARFPRYGMTDMTFTREHPHHWGWIRTTADDLDRLVNFVLTRMPPKHRDYLVREMRMVDPNQQWGVWGAGAAAQPGNKNGWADDNDDGSWITNSVGFAGPRERFSLAIMNDTKVVQGGFEVGRTTTTEISRILFDGYFN
ncbi:class A beta-lactamase-related serine hydrolase [Pendulispora brunnea]|uniref:beta-lactamase n=1 Tax=Pendulispora brunnea TaxID=2905690 RepID=A0ABZ2K7P0_9BACT